LVLGLSHTGKGLGGLEKPEKIFLNNPNLIYALAPDAGIGNSFLALDDMEKGFGNKIGIGGRGQLRFILNH
jgi:hypothetical protein